MEVELVPLLGAEGARFQAHLRRTVNAFPGAHFLSMSYLTERIEETLSRSTAPLVLKIVGDNLDGLVAATLTIDAVVRPVPGAVDVQSSPAAVSPEVRATQSC